MQPYFKSILWLMNLLEKATVQFLQFTRGLFLQPVFFLLAKMKACHFLYRPYDIMIWDSNSLKQYFATNIFCITLFILYICAVLTNIFLFMIMLQAFYIQIQKNNINLKKSNNLVEILSCYSQD